MLAAGQAQGCAPCTRQVLTPQYPNRPLQCAIAGRNVDEDSPAKGRMAKVARTAGAVGAMAPPPATAGSAYLNVCHQVRGRGSG